MRTAKGAGQAIGLLFLTQMIVSYLVNFAWLGKVFATPGFLVNAAAHPTLMGLCAVLGVAIGALGVAVAIIAFPVFRSYSYTWALWFFALAVAGFSVVVVENVNVMSMLSLSEAYAKASEVERQLFQPLRGAVASSRNWAHYLELVIGGSNLVVFYAGQLRFRLIPRALAAFGVAAALSQIAAVGMPLFGHDVVFPMLAPLGLSQLALSLWLLTKGWPAEGPGAPASAGPG